MNWSDHADPTSHCWLPYSSNKSNVSSVQCAICDVIFYANNCTDIPAIWDSVHHELPPCRPSFFSSNTTETGMYDIHCWLCVPILKERCFHCNRKSFSNKVHGANNRVSSASTIDRRTADDLIICCTIENAEKNMEKSYNNLVCMWCLRSYHRQCWESTADEVKSSKCDYGILGNMVVRPQWLRCLINSSEGFRAKSINSSETNCLLSCPVIFFMNKLSGGQKSEEVYHQLVRRLNPRQIFLLENDSTIIQAMNIFSSLTNIRICVCGGDGTVGWVLNSLIEIFPQLGNPPVSILPLGTGNDLSRVLGWGHKYDPKRLFRTLIQITHAKPIALDRWEINFERLVTTTELLNPEQLIVPRCLCFVLEHPAFVRSTDSTKYDDHSKPINKYFFSHMSFGLDAAIALDFHIQRMRDPSQFTSPLKNKVLYLNESRKYVKYFIFSQAWNLALYMKLICDDKDLTDSIRSCHTLVLMNSSGYASGTNPWNNRLMNTTDNPSTTPTVDSSISQMQITSNPSIDKERNTSQFTRQCYNDGKIEVIGLSAKQMALIHLGFRGRCIAQCGKIRLEFNHPICAQMDGEPFYLKEPIAINVTHAGQGFVLRNDNR